MAKARVVGIDPSTSCTGVALPGGALCSVRAGFAVHNDDPPPVRVRRASLIATRLAVVLRREVEANGPIDCGVVEGYLMGAPGGEWTLIRLVEVGFAVRFVLDQLRIPFVEIPPSTNKRWGAGTGGATKEQMIAAARAAGADPHDDNEADAFHLQSIGLAQYGDWDELTDEQRLVLHRYPWPELIADVVPV